MDSEPDHFLLICSTCAGESNASELGSALANKLPSRFAIRMVDCMAGCDRPTTIGFQAVGKAQYLFGDICEPVDLEAVAAFAIQYENSADGWTKATDRPPALFRKTLSRLPQIVAEQNQ